MANRDSILKSKGNTLLTKVDIVKAMVVPVVRYECDIKKAECEELMLSNCGAGEDSLEPLGLQGGQTSQY